jgi:hypothetical protein
LGCMLAHVLWLKKIQAEFCIISILANTKNIQAYRQLIWNVGSQNKCFDNGCTCPSWFHQLGFRLLQNFCHYLLFTPSLHLILCIVHTNEFRSIFSCSQRGHYAYTD